MVRLNENRRSSDRRLGRPAASNVVSMMASLWATRLGLTSNPSEILPPVVLTDLSLHG